MKSLIIYASHHHGSTKKLAEAIAAKHGAVLLDAEASGKSIWKTMR